MTCLLLEYHPLLLRDLLLPLHSEPRGSQGHKSLLLVLLLHVAEPPELSRLKCAGHHHKGNTSSNALQTEQFLVCRVTSRYNHRFSDRTSIPCTKASPEILQPHILQQKHNSYYKPVQSIITDPNSVNIIQAISLKFRV